MQKLKDSAQATSFAPARHAVRRVQQAQERAKHVLLRGVGGDGQQVDDEHQGVLVAERARRPAALGGHVSGQLKEDVKNLPAARAL